MSAANENFYIEMLMSAWVGRIREGSESQMQSEQQTEQAVTAPEVAPQPDSTDSKPIKKQHGGKRAGAGRKPDLVKRMVSRLTPATAQEVLTTVDVEKVIKDISRRAV
ncbi:MAG TPA: hypothetical protein VFN26_05855 [Candidatus Acidoferrum sp.]|nr:hypothetical protein [Candidatus Acidoferrum sp.]